MKNKLPLMLSFVLLISACSISLEIGGGTSNSLSTNRTDVSINPSTNHTSNSSTSNAITGPLVTSNTINTTRDPSLPTYSFKLDSSNIDSSNNYLSDYSTGNYGTTSSSGISYTFYRAYRSASGQLMDLIPYNGSENDGSLPGLFYNNNPIYDISSITIEYSTSLSGENKPVLKFGSDYHVSSSIDLEPNSSKVSVTHEFLGNINYFRLESSSYRLKIYSMSITYTNTNINDRSQIKNAYDDDYRLNPIVFGSSTLVSGVSKVIVPTEINRNSDSYEITKTKELTYYSYNDVVSNPALADEAALTEPEDVAAYFIAFKTYPANYVAKKSYSSAYTYFGSNTRCVSSYSRTDGYATSVPYNYGSNFIYYECDIDLDGTYNKSNRGVGRVVVWFNGFDADGYDESPVAVYTDDHYATFQEYFNYGSFGERFDAEMAIVHAKWSNPTTLN